MTDTGPWHPLIIGETPTTREYDWEHSIACGGTDQCPLEAVIRNGTFDLVGHARDLPPGSYRMRSCWPVALIEHADGTPITAATDIALA
jgi:hypothetical protein